MPIKRPLSTQHVASWIRHALFLLVLFSFFGAFTFFERFARLQPRTSAARCLNAIQAFALNPDTQWMLFSCAWVYVGFAFFLKYSKCPHKICRFRNPDLWLALFSTILLISYGFNYDMASQSNGPLSIILGITLGRWVHPLKKCVLSKPSATYDVQIVLGMIVSLLTVLSLWTPWARSNIEYNGELRWVGVWDNPNEFGLFMGLGVIIALGLLMAKIVSWTNSSYQTRRQRFLISTSLLIAVFFLGIALIKSYSRGALIGTFFALCYIGKTSGFFSKCCSLFSIWRIPRTYLVRIAWLALLSLPLLFWRFQFTENIELRRFFSIVNENDFSWRNRASAYHGALQVMMEEPLVGFGWLRPETIFVQFFRPERFEEGTAIRLNSQLLLGMTLGLPAMFCFFQYVFLSLIPSGFNLKKTPQQAAVHAVCGGAAIIFFIQFWFSGGLFDLSTAAPFWVFLELGKNMETSDPKSIES